MARSSEKVETEYNDFFNALKKRALGEGVGLSDAELRQQKDTIRADIDASYDYGLNRLEEDANRTGMLSSSAMMNLKRRMMESKGRELSGRMSALDRWNEQVRQQAIGQALGLGAQMSSQEMAWLRQERLAHEQRKRAGKQARMKFWGDLAGDTLAAIGYATGAYLGAPSVPKSGSNAYNRTDEGVPIERIKLFD